MPKWSCFCGELINLSDIPSVNVYYFTTEKYLLSLQVIDYSEAINKFKTALVCPYCFRQYLFLDKAYTEAKVYKLQKRIENTDPDSAFQSNTKLFNKYLYISNHLLDEIAVNISTVELLEEMDTLYLSIDEENLMFCVPSENLVYSYLRDNDF
ncbi:MAG: hypothetical protein U0Y96_08690 [Candidatus Kapaibacterium sp.]